MDEVIRADTVKIALMPVFTAEDVRWLRDKLILQGEGGMSFRAVLVRK